MADRTHLDLLKKGVPGWNAWRAAAGDVVPDLRGADLKGRDLSGAVFSGGDLREVDFSGADLSRTRFVEARLDGANCISANLDGADLTGAEARDSRFVGANLFEACLAQANFDGAHFEGADLAGANLRSVLFHKADLRGAEIRFADACRADLTEADLRHASLINSDLSKADLTGAHIFGLSAWELKLDQAVQRDLVITPPWEPEIVADDLDLASFLGLALRNGSIRQVFESAASRIVLILGQSVPAKAPILELLRDCLRRRGLFPVSFDVPNPGSPEIEARISAIAPFVRFALSDLPESFDDSRDTRAQLPRIPSLSLFVLSRTPADGAKTVPAPAGFEDRLFSYTGVEALRKAMETEILPGVLGSEPTVPPEAGFPPPRSIFRLFEGRRKTPRAEEA
jgi:uncharacterized protein YjbI with pentapeptide repeats